MQSRATVIITLFALGFGGRAFADPADDPRPQGTSVGIGLGYQLSPLDTISLGSPNITSVRFRFANGIEVEPEILFQHVVTTGAPDAEGSFDEKWAAAAVRVPVARRGRVDLDLVFRATVGTSASTYPGMAADDLTTRSFEWGLAVAYWFSPHWQLSLTATDPLYDQSAGYDNTTPYTIVRSGVIFEPLVTAMVHLYL